jgi:hypothetical protein
MYGFFANLASTWKCGLSKFDSLVYLLVGQLGKFSEAQHHIQYLGINQLDLETLTRILSNLAQKPPWILDRRPIAD